MTIIAWLINSLIAKPKKGLTNVLISTNKDEEVTLFFVFLTNKVTHSRYLKSK